MKEALLLCLCCGKTLENAFPNVENQPSGGTEFSTLGHYGSTFWDPMDNLAQLVLNICDDCLRAHTDRLAIRRVRRVRPVESIVKYDDATAVD